MCIIFPVFVAVELFQSVCLKALLPVQQVVQRVVRIIYNGWQFAQQTPLYRNCQFAANHTLVYSIFWCRQCFCFSPHQQSTLNSPQQNDRKSPTFCGTIWRISASWANRICSSSSCLQPLCPACLLVQTVVSVDTQVLVLLHYINILSQVRHRLCRCPFPSEVDHHLSGLFHIWKQKISFRPLHKIIHQQSVLLLLPITLTSSCCKIIRVFL